MELSEKVKPLDTAILVIDIQNDFCDSEGAFAKKLGWNPQPIQEMIPRLERFLSQARKCGLQVIFSRMINDAELSPNNLKERLLSGAEKGAGEWPYALIKDSWGFDFYKIKPEENDIVMDKTYYDFFTNQKLKTKLMDMGIKNIVITGVYAEVCALTTAQRAFSEGYNVIIPSDLVGSIKGRETEKETVLNLVGGYSAEVVESKEIIEAWKG